MPALLQRRNAVLPFRATALTPLPQQAAILARWSAVDIPAQADNTALDSWTDSVTGLSAGATGAARPKYRTEGANGKPHVLFSGAQALNAGASNAVATACQSGNNTVLVVYRNPTGNSSTYGFLFTASNSTGYNLFDYGVGAPGRSAGMFGSGLQRVPFAGTGLTTLCYTAGQPDGTSGRIYINNSCISHQGVVTSAAGHNVGIGGSSANLALGFNGEVYDVIVWNRALTAAEVMQAEKWARERYASPYPWAGAAFRVFHGDSLTNGLGASAPLTTMPARVAAANGWAFGQWTNLGHVGARYDNNPASLTLEALSDVDPMVALLGATPLHLATWEWYNGRNRSNYQTEAIAYLAARKAAGVAKLIFGTSIDTTDAAGGGETAANRTARAAYNSYWDTAGNRTAAGIDAYVAIHTDRSIGAEGACPGASPFTPYFYTDGIHLIDAGYQKIADLFASAMT